MLQRILRASPPGFACRSLPARALVYLACASDVSQTAGCMPLATEALPPVLSRKTSQLTTYNCPWPNTHSSRSYCDWQHKSQTAAKC